MDTAGGTEPGAGPRCRVFLSYSRDDRDRAMPVIAALEQAGIEVWWDGLLTGGDAFLQTTEAMLEGADAVVVLWTETSVQSHWVRDEATHGRERQALVPVTLDGSKPPLGFRQIQYVNLIKWRGQIKAPEFVELLRAIEPSGASHPSPCLSAAPFWPAVAQR
jgi:TIR domain